MGVVASSTAVLAAGGAAGVAVVATSLAWTGSDVAGVIRETVPLVIAFGTIFTAYVAYQTNRNVKASAIVQVATAEKTDAQLAETKEALAVVKHQTDGISASLVTMAGNSQQNLVDLTAKSSEAEGKEKQRIAALEAQAALAAIKTKP